MKPKNMKNPIVDGWMADPEARFYEGRYWIYVTSEPRNVTVYSSEDLVAWEKHMSIIDMDGFDWAKRLIWAPTIIEKNGLYYLVFAANDIQSDEEPGGLGIAVSESPKGPFRALLDRPLIDHFINGAQPIDAHLFKDDDGSIYMYYGGWGHCNVTRMNEDLTGFVPFEDGEVFREITPEGYVEAPCMLKKDGLYYFMWSTGDYGNSSYAVLYCVSNSPTGPFETGAVMLSSQPPLAEGPGHHGYLYYEPTGDWLIVYHRRYVGLEGAGKRILCIDKMNIHDGIIDRVIMTDEWVLG